MTQSSGGGRTPEQDESPAGLDGSAPDQTQAPEESSVKVPGKGKRRSSSTGRAKPRTRVRAPDQIEIPAVSESSAPTQAAAPDAVATSAADQAPGLAVPAPGIPEKPKRRSSTGRRAKSATGAKAADPVKQLVVAEEGATVQAEETPASVVRAPDQIEVLAELPSPVPELVEIPAAAEIVMAERAVESLESRGSTPVRRARLVAEHLRKQYGARVVVKDVSLTVEAGEVVGLLGPNGAGKTTCFYMVVGLVPMDGGTITLDGESIAHLPIHRRARRGLSYLPQEASVFRRLTVEENVRAVLELQIDEKGLPLAADVLERQLDALLVDLQIEHLRTNSAQSLSGGERRRVEIAGALAAQPRFILLDEPFAGIDPIAVIEIQRIVRFLKERGIGVLITDHNVRETLGICDHAYIINEGQVLASGAPRDIIDNDSVRRVYLGEHFRM